MKINHIRGLTRNLRPQGAFEYMFGNTQMQERIIVAVRKSLDAKSNPFLMCQNCNMFRIKGFNGGSWNIDDPLHQELRRAIQLIGLRIPELKSKSITELVDLDYCNLCAGPTNCFKGM